MHQMLKTRKEDDDQTPSAFYQTKTGKSPPSCGWLVKSPTPCSLLHGSNKRDSGYGTDFSPASNTSATNRFTFNDDMETPEDNDVIEDLEYSDVFDAPYSDVIHEEDESDDDTDKEVEELIGGGGDIRRPLSQPIQIKRPSAPIPTPEDEAGEEESENVDTSNSEEDLMISAPFNHTPWSNMPRNRRNKFRPIASRSVGTQTPSPHSQLITEAMGPVGSPRMPRVTALTRLRIRSESEDIPNGALPDVIPMSRDRSISLPDVPSFRRREQEQVVGRELRRISDEFNSSFTLVRRRRSTVQLPSSFPLRVNIDFYAYFANIRRFLSSSPVFQNNQDERDARPPHGRNDFFH